MGNRLFVGNLPYEITEEQVRGFFENEGRSVQEVFIPTDRGTGRPRGFAFVTLGSNEEATAAIETLNGKELSGRGVSISEARERAARIPQGPPAETWGHEDSRQKPGRSNKAGGSRRRRRHKRIL